MSVMQGDIFWVIESSEGAYLSETPGVFVPDIIHARVYTTEEMGKGMFRQWSEYYEDLVLVEVTAYFMKRKCHD